MIGRRAGQRDAAFDHVQAGSSSRLGLPAGGEIPGVAHGRRMRAQRVGVETDDDPRPIQPQVRPKRPAKAKTAPARWLSSPVGSYSNHFALGNALSNRDRSAASVGELVASASTRKPAPPVLCKLAENGPGTFRRTVPSLFFESLLLSAA